MFKKSIITGIGIIVLLMLAGSAGATPAFFSVTPAPDCSYCHKSNLDLKAPGIYFNATHRFDGIELPESVASCTTCHTQITAPAIYLPLTSVGQSYNTTHRYNSTTLASTRLVSPGCANCHVDVTKADFTRLTSTPTYLKSTTCENCHKAKYDKWSNTLHAVMLTPKAKAQAMGLPTPEVGWANISYVIVSKFQLVYFNTTGYGLANNDTYETETEEWINYRNGKPYGTCGSCHTTGWNTSGWSASAKNGILPGINGTFVEPGIACERCHKPAGNGHQVVVNYSGNQCQECHILSGSHATGWEKGAHAPPPYENGTSCMFCHSSFDQYKNQGATKANATGVSCGVCHNIHDMTDSKYAATFTGGTFDAETWSEVANAKLSFFNATASIAAGTDVFDDLSSINFLYPGTDSSRKDASYGTAPINVTGKPDSEKLCSTCHYRHGLEHIAGVNLTHGTYYYGKQAGATCVDCHMNEKSAISTREPMRQHANDPLTPNSCGGATGCHTTSAQNLSKSSHSVVPVINEWEASAHNPENAAVEEGGSCVRCHSPMNWNPANETPPIPEDELKGVTCAVCHNIHDMGDWLAKTKAAFGEAKGYAWYDKDAIVAAKNATTGLPTRYKANYSMMKSTTELCTNCHQERSSNLQPGWTTSTRRHGAVTPHYSSQKEMFVGSWKEKNRQFECSTCHMASAVTDPITGNVLPDSQKVNGHTFKVNAAVLQNKTECSGCHATGVGTGNLSKTVDDIKTEIRDNWNVTNATVESTWSVYNAYMGEKNLSSRKLAESFFKLYQVSNDRSWGVHNKVLARELLQDASRLANEATAALGQKAVIVSTVQLKAGWNLVSLNGTPSVTTTASVMSSVASNITVVWGYNASKATWEIYDPSMIASLNTLQNILPGKGYWIYAKTDVVWTA